MVAVTFLEMVSVVAPAGLAAVHHKVAAENLGPMDLVGFGEVEPFG